MKKLDKLILGAYLGPFLITFLVVVFILLNIQMLKYFDDIFGKGLDWYLIVQLFFYFAVYTTPTALPLAVLLSSLITYGNLGEHFELTAIKSAGISLLRTLRPIFLFILILTVFSYYFNNNFQPRAALEAYSLLFDIKQKKPALDLREGIFYYGIPNISIKVNQKFPDGITLKDIIIYDHQRNDGNKEVTVADSGKMYTILNERYLKFELFNGVNYQEGSTESEMVGQRRSRNKETLSRSTFDKSQVVFDLSSFTNMERTDKGLFKSNRIMRNMTELEKDLDSINRDLQRQRLELFTTRQAYFNYYSKKDSLILPPEVYKYKLWRDSAVKARPVTSDIYDRTEILRSTPVTRQVRGGDEVDSVAEGESDNKRPLNRLAQRQQSLAQRRNPIAPLDSTADSTRLVVTPEMIKHRIDSVSALPYTGEHARDAVDRVRQARGQLTVYQVAIKGIRSDQIIFQIQWHKIIASSIMCIVMFLIGAPLGAIIKRGGLGVPFLVSIFFFIIYYVLSIQGEKFAKQGHISVITGVWLPDVVLLIVGILFLRQARIDARLFDADAYRVGFDKFLRWIGRWRAPRAAQAS